VRGNALDKESKAYADAAIPAIITTWLDKALLDGVRREFNQQRNLLCPLGWEMRPELSN
jgi:hypothetical protein